MRSLPPSAWPVAAGASESGGAAPARAQPPHARHWRSRAPILAIFGQTQRRVPRSPASLRLFEVSLRALICLPPAASPARQFLVESLLTAPLPTQRRGTGGARAGSGAGNTRGAPPNIPPGAPSRAQWGNGARSTLVPQTLFWAQSGLSVVPQGCSSSLNVCHDGGRQCSSYLKSSQGQCLALLIFWVLQMSLTPAVPEHPSSEPSVPGVF